jgi:hypothetical protein
MDLNEMTHLVSLLKTIEPESMMEIGPHEGATSRQILDHVPSIKEYWGLQLLNPTGLWKWQEGEVPAEPAKHVIKDPRFHAIFREWGSYDCTSRELPQVDVVFIDGGHDIFGVMHDTGLAKRVAKKMIIWHDYNDIVDVKPFLDFLQPYLPTTHIPTTWLCYHTV